MLRGLQTSNPRKYKVFLDLFLGPLVARGRRAGLPAEDAEEVALDILLAVIQAAPTFDKERVKSFTNWVASFAWRRILNQLRVLARRSAQQPRHPEQNIEALPSPECPSVEEADFANQLLERMVKRVQGRCPDLAWSLFEETEIKGRPAADVASEFKVTAQQVYDSRSRVRKLLRQAGNELLAD
jgi:RNA polymerase sigma factor (sigma-70 family)